MALTKSLFEKDKKLELINTLPSSATSLAMEKQIYKYLFKNYTDNTVKIN